MKYRFHILDVFTTSAFGGNQLAVLPDARGISAEGMQKIAREFNFAESTFVLPAEDSGNTRRVRIFTPKAEIPFAGHPTIGTAAALVMTGELGPGDRHSLVLEEGVGPVGVEVERRAGALHATLTVTNALQQPAMPLHPDQLAAVLSLRPGEVLEGFFASVGLPFCFARLASREAVDRATLDRGPWKEHLSGAWSPDIFLFAGDPANGAEFYARMFAPAFGIEEDPATGSASAALAAALASRFGPADGEFRLSILQGVAMGRRSEIHAVGRKTGGALVSVSVGGASAYVASGEIEVPEAFLS